MGTGEAGKEDGGVRGMDEAGSMAGGTIVDRRVPVPAPALSLDGALVCVWV